MNNHVPSDEWCFMKWLKWQGNSTWTSISNIRSPRQKTTKQRILMRICWSFWTIVSTVTMWSLTWHVFFPSKQWQLMASTCQVQCPGQRVGKCIAGDFSVRIPWNCMQMYAMVWNHKITWWRFWNHMKLVTSWAPNLERSSSISPSRTSRPQLLWWRCSVLIFVHWFDDFTPWPLPKGAEYKVHRYFLEAFEQVPKHLGNPR